MNGRQYAVTLLAPNGRQQPVELVIARDGVRLLTLEGKEINVFAYETIRKWLPSHLRSKNPGAEDCLDLQVETDKGPRDLRMQCGSPASVKSLIRDLRATTEALMREMDDQQVDATYTTTVVDNNTTTTVGGYGVDRAAYAAVAPAPAAQPTYITNVGATSPYTIPYDGAAGRGYQQHLQQQQQGSPMVVHAMDSSCVAQLFVAQPTGITLPVGPDGSVPGPVLLDGLQAAALTGAMAQQQQPSPRAGGETEFDVTSRAGSYAPGYFNTLYDGQLGPMGMQRPMAFQQQRDVGMGPPPPSTRGDVEPASHGARRKVEFSTVTDPAGDGRPEGKDLTGQVRFLEELVARLSTEVSRRGVAPDRAAAAAMALAGVHGYGGAAAAAAPYSGGSSAPRSAAGSPRAAGMLPYGAMGPPSPPDLDALLANDALGTAAVLRDQKLLQPMLSAYDQRIKQLEADLCSRTEQLQALKSQVDDVAEENDRLRSELAKTAESRDLALAGAGAGAAGASSGAAAEELDLLRQENELLVAQQSDLDQEIQRLHRQLQDRTQETMRSGQDQAAMVAQATQATQRCQELEARLTKLTAALKASEAKAAALMSETSRSRAVADDDKAVAASTKAALDELRQQYNHIVLEHQAAQQRYKGAADGTASLQLELSTARERNDALSGQVAALQREGDALRSALSNVESKLAEYQRRDAEAYARVKEATAAAEEARMARDAAQSRQADAERQLELANTRLATVRQATKEAAAEEYGAQLAAAQAAAVQAREELTVAQATVSEWRTRTERLEREHHSLLAELSSLREDASAALVSKSRLGLASLGAVEKVAAVERERDDATSKLDSLSRKHERAQRDWQMERQAYEHSLRALKSSVAELEGALGASRAETSTAKRQAEAAAREAAAVKAARAHMETELRLQMSAIRTERDAEVKTLSARLEAAVAAANTSAAEAERLLAAKQEVLARWREEAQLLASKLEGALSEHKREVHSRAGDLSELRARAEALAQENVALAGNAHELDARVEELEAQLMEAEARAEAGEAQLVSATTRESDLVQELRQVQALLDRTHYEKSRIQHAHDPLTAKYDALKKDVRAVSQRVQAASAGADALVHAVRASVINPATQAH